MLTWNVVDHSDWQLVMEPSSPTIEQESRKISSSMRTLFQHNSRVMIAVTDIHGRINALRAQKGDSFPCRYALAFCLSGKMASEMRQCLWWSDVDHTRDIRDLLHELDTELTALYLKPQELQRFLDLDSALQRLQNWRAGMPSHVSITLYPKIINYLVTELSKASLKNFTAPTRQISVTASEPETSAAVARETAELLSQRLSHTTASKNSSQSIDEYPVSSSFQTALQQLL
jgi:hypothetical protein